MSMDTDSLNEEFWILLLFIVCSPCITCFLVKLVLCLHASCFQLLLLLLPFSSENYNAINQSLLQSTRHSEVRLSNYDSINQETDIEEENYVDV